MPEVQPEGRGQMKSRSVYAFRCAKARAVGDIASVNALLGFIADDPKPTSERLNAHLLEEVTRKLRHAFTLGRHHGFRVRVSATTEKIEKRA